MSLLETAAGVVDGLVIVSVAARMVAAQNCARGVPPWIMSASTNTEV
jgi:hypothetical protein